ncbi:MAG TPA: SDR family NAD(P)-dependent oxidoreductase [Nocardioidaceae bacterium]|nr:SDR family NAD(P)-dependent oxidoreductase [Nocardioidaceae bacterium]
MQLAGARTLVVGGTGALGTALARTLRDHDARLVLTGRSRLPDHVEGVEATISLDLLDLDAARGAVTEAADRLGGLDLVVVATGVAAFGAAAETSDEVAEELFAVNTLGPMAVLSAAVPAMSDGGVLVAVSAVLADAPMAGMAAYSASKAGLSAYLTALRREVRRHGVTVLDARPPHMETGLADRAISGTPPRLPAGHDVDDFVALLVEAIRAGARELVWDPGEKALALR